MKNEIIISVDLAKYLVCHRRGEFLALARHMHHDVAIAWSRWVKMFGAEFKEAASDIEFGVVNTDKVGFSKIITIANITNEERFQEIMSSPKMIEWDKAHNNTDVIYSIERIS